jgi:hypothetical protein
MLLLLAACEFEPSEIPETLVTPPGDKAPLLLIEVKPDMDTLKLATDVWAEFIITSPEAEIHWIKISFDGDLVYDALYNTHTMPRVPIVISRYSEGLHIFSIKVFAASNSGSIADKVGGEGFLYEAHWPVLIRHNIDRSIQINQIQYFNSAAWVIWEKYDYHDFYSYTLNKSTLSNANKAQYHITNPHLTLIRDTTYIEGEYAFYSVSLNSEWAFNSTDFYVPIKAPDISLTPDNKMVVRWNRTTNPKRLGYYHIAYKLPDYSVNQEFIKDSPDDTVTLVNTSPGFGNFYEFQVRYVPKDYSGPYINYSSVGGITHFSVGNPMPEFENAYRIGDSENILLYNKGWFYKYNFINQTLTDSLQVTDLASPASIRISPNGLLFSYFTLSDFVMQHTSDWSQVNRFYTPVIHFGTPRFMDVSISDQYHLVVVEHGSVLTITDVRAGRELARRVGKPGEVIHRAVINSQGDKILYDYLVNNEYKNYLQLTGFDGAALTDIGRTAAATPGANYDVIQFGFRDDKVFMLKNTWAYNYRWEERNAADFSLIYGFDLPDSFVPVAIDFREKQLVARYGLYGSFDNSYSLLFDFGKGTSHKIRPIIKGKKFVLANQTLANGSGRYLTLNELIQKP